MVADFVVVHPGYETVQGGAKMDPTEQKPGRRCQPIPQGISIDSNGHCKLVKG